LQRFESGAQERGAAAADAHRSRSADTASANAQRDEASSAEGRRLLAPARNPDEWLRHIAKLRDEGRHDEARESLNEFRRQYPEHRIPDELR
jgi:hypothetical protein